MRHIYAKLGVHRRTEAVDRARELGCSHLRPTPLTAVRNYSVRRSRRDPALRLYAVAAVVVIAALGWIATRYVKHRTERALG